MPHTRQPSMLLRGLVLALRYPGAILWTYALNLALALVFSWRLHTQLGSLLDHSLEAQRLHAAFDLGTVSAVNERLTHGVPSAGSSSYLGVLVYFAAYFLLVPGALFAYRLEAPGLLSILLSAGARFGGRFLRIVLLTALFSAAILVPLSALALLWSSFIDARLTGWHALLLKAAGFGLVFLVTIFLRLYFDLVEVYTIQLDAQILPTGFPDRRVRRTLLPALRTLGRHLPRAYGTFLTLTLLGLAAFLFFARVAVHTLAQPRVWPQFLLAQLGLLLMLLTRFWQRAAETVLAGDNFLPPPSPQPILFPGVHSDLYERGAEEGRPDHVAPGDVN